jgi:hypothetical protein
MKLKEHDGWLDMEFIKIQSKLKKGKILIKLN